MQRYPLQASGHSKAHGAGSTDTTVSCKMHRRKRRLALYYSLPGAPNANDFFSASIAASDSSAAK